jgi:L,D-transpeptidase YcbB
VRSRQRIKISLLLCIASTLLSAPVSAQVKPGGASAQLSTIVASGNLPDLRWPDFSDYRIHLTNFYRPSAYKPAWIRDGQPTPQSLEIIKLFQEADQKGLRPEDYDAPRWADRLTTLKNPHQDDDEARFDAALTVCIMRYISDLHIGRVNPQNLGFEFDVEHKKLYLPDFVRQRLVNGSDLRSELAAIEPPFAAYKRLIAALQHYIDLQKTDDREKVLDAGPVSPGDQYAGIAGLAKRLRLLGDLPDTVTIPPDQKTYDGPLVDAVKHFQGRFRLQPTGQFDYKTLVEINVPLSDRIEQMQLGLERLRWLPYTFKQPPIVINVPEFRLYAFNEKSEVGLTMRVNVGEDYNHQTPMFEGNIQYLVFRPYWTPPPNILKKEIIPDIEKNPSLSDLNLELVGANGEVIKSGDVTPAMLQQVRSGRLTVRQPPGPENGMGLVKFIFPNQHDVYIHDTPASLDMFSEAAEGKEGELQRVASHGCIHLQYPDKFAAYLLRNNPSWDLDKVDKAMHEGKDNMQVNLAPPTPVLIFYLTAVAEENGEIHFFHDIYDHDRTLKLELAHGYPYPK